jgi:hypothetical protein
MAEIVDLEIDTTTELDPAPADSTEVTVEEPVTPAAAAPEDDLPPQFKGKSLAEVAKYAAATEKSLSRQGQELGEIRKLADELIKSQLVKKPEPEAPKEVDFFENPQEAIRNAVGNDPRLKAIEQQNIVFQQQQARQVLAQKHPDFSEIVLGDPEFAKWVGGSKIRTALFQAAEKFDVDAADELLSTYKQLKTVKVAQQAQETAKVDTKARDAALKTVAVDTSGSGETTRKVYRRADLIRLKMRDPARYESMGDEIMAAYAQGRVR